MPESVEFLFSPGSRYCYLAASQVPALEAETGCRVDWRPVDGRALRALRGHDPFVGEPPSGQYDWTYRRTDAEAWADYYGIPFREPPAHELDFDLLVRAATVAKRLGAAAVYGWRLSAAVYASAAWPVDEALCVRLADESRLPTQDFRTMLRDTETRQRMDEAARDAHARGAFGVPTFFVRDRMFWGNDRVVLLRYYLRRLAGGL